MQRQTGTGQNLEREFHAGIQYPDPLARHAALRDPPALVCQCKGPCESDHEYCFSERHRTFLGLALFNYRIPGKWAHTPHEEFGLAASSGLALGFGQTDVKASTIGWFGGLSMHLYYRLFMTAGVHVGQFANFPPGLSTGSTIPANYGDLNPVKKTTARFAFAVTYQTTSLAREPPKRTRRRIRPTRSTKGAV